MSFFKREKTLSELEEDTERLEGQDRHINAQLSIEQKRAAIAQLKQRGVSPKHFGVPTNWKKILQWLKTH